MSFLKQPEPPSDAYANLARAVELGGEGGTLTLLGPHEGEGEFYVVRPVLLDVDEEGFATYGGADLLPAGSDLIGALDQLQPHWRIMLGVHVAPRFESLIRAELERSQGARSYSDWRLHSPDFPMRCRYVWPDCELWDDGIGRDSFWVEGNLDQVREVLGEITRDHQQQLGLAANRPFVMLISQDGQHRQSLPYIESTEEDPWPSETFIPVGSHDLLDLAQLQTIPVPQRTSADSFAPLPQAEEQQSGQTPVDPGVMLDGGLGMAHYETLRRAARQKHPGPQGRNQALDEALWEMAQMTWPIRVIRGPDQSPGFRPRYDLFFVHGMGMEEDLWHFLGDHRERDAIRMSILLRNLYYAGNRDALESGHLHDYLRYAMPAVRQINGRPAEDGL